MVNAMPTQDPEVIIIGGGPAGATAATILAQHGHRVRLYERERMPRFHIGDGIVMTEFTGNR